jgi:hypothetical protein
MNFTNEKERQEAKDRAEKALPLIVAYAPIFLGPLRNVEHSINVVNNRAWFRATRSFKCEITITFEFGPEGKPRVTFNWPSGGSREEARMINDCIAFGDRMAAIFDV